ncbi:hypothetical protein ZHAS_00012428 [Anopheles sinensis]|uniref:Uncharacterized protein n=1 Tax=Anopheles sinensis TaxID=74873 RepID=A0A084W2V5_ANOSI|nr:hypothetical protein ZHAS_00012428 [Anopheles sinensis]
MPGRRTTTESSVDTDVVTGITSVPDESDEMPNVGGSEEGGGEEGGDEEGVDEEGGRKRLPKKKVVKGGSS